MKQVIDTIQKINSLELLLKHLLKPIHLSTSEDPLIKELASTIYNIQQNQFNYFIENKMQLRKIFMNATSAYCATLHNSYLDIITEIKKVITNTNLAYDPTQLPYNCRTRIKHGIIKTSLNIVSPQHVNHCTVLTNNEGRKRIYLQDIAPINKQTVRFTSEVFSPDKTKRISNFPNIKHYKTTKLFALLRVSLQPIRLFSPDVY